VTRRGWSTIAVGLTALALGGCGTVPGLSGTAEGACAAPIVTIEPAEAAPGDTVAVTSDGWSVCEDTPNDPSGEAPWTEVQVAWAQGEKLLDLGSTEIVDGAVEVDVTVPDDAAPGPARIRVSYEGLNVDGILTVTD